MAFKTDTSFLEKLTMGAVGTRAVIAVLNGFGFQPIELERYSTSNKIWSTKVKRLRLPDVLCLRTGLRFEVRAKSDFQVKMSDAPDNPDRRWDSGLRDDDLVAFVPCDVGATTVRGAPVFFLVADMRASVGTTKLGDPKSAAEGAERDRTWPATVPKRGGEVVAVEPSLVRVRFDNGKGYTYQLKGKRCYLGVGDRFAGEGSFIAGVIPRILDPRTLLGATWNPTDLLRSPNPTDRYVAAKAIPKLPTAGRQASEVLSAAFTTENEPRTALEMAGGLALLGVPQGLAHIEAVIFNPTAQAPAYLPIEAVLVLAELKTPSAAALLVRVADHAGFTRNEIRQVAVWCLGRAGIENYDALVKFIGDEENEVALHAIAGFSDRASSQAIDAVLSKLTSVATSREKAAASEVLTRVGTQAVAEKLANAGATAQNPWITATLGRFPSSVLGTLQFSDALRRAIEPVRVVSRHENWIADPKTAAGLDFLMRQQL